MIMNKRSTHTFETCSIKVELGEFPFDAGEELHLEIEPIENIEHFSLTGNPENDQMLSFKVNDAYVWIKWDYKLLPMLEKAITEYKERWSDYYQSLQGSTNSLET